MAREGIRGLRKHNGRGLEKSGSNFDSWSELTIKLEKKDIIDVCKSALKEKIIKLHDILSEEDLQELRSSLEKLDSMKSELDKMLSIFSNKLQS